MTYSKPKLDVLGDAASIIQGQKTGSPPESLLQPRKQAIVMAYELDE